MKKTLGGDRLGSEGKMQVDLHGYGSSTHDLSEVFRSSMAAGTLVPFAPKVMLPGSRVEAYLDADVRTLPTTGPLFGSFKLQVDAFWTPARLYNAMVLVNTPEIGLNMENAKIPQIRMTAFPAAAGSGTINKSTFQINPSSLLSYLGMKGIGITTDSDGTERDFQALLILQYWHIYYQYYSNKQEGIGAVIHTTQNTTNTETVDEINMVDSSGDQHVNLEMVPNTNNSTTMSVGWKFEVTYTGTTPNPKQLMINTEQLGSVSIFDLSTGNIQDTGSELMAFLNTARWGNITPVNWHYRENTGAIATTPELATFPLSNITDMQREILAHMTADPFLINTANIEPYKWLYEYNATTKINNVAFAQEGLGLKTYLSDVNHNWLSEDLMAGVNLKASVSTAGNTFTIDRLALTKKVWEVLNRIAVSGGTYDNWIEAVYGEKMMRQVWSPVYQGGMAQEIVFDAVVSQSEQPGQPLGTLAAKGELARGTMRGGKVEFEVGEPGFLLFIASITPRVDYSQGNEWFTQLQTWDDFHKPGLDGIGFQNLITEGLAWWDTHHNTITWVTKSAGKQPAWINYQTAINKTYGNFAIEDNEMFMTLNRRYEPDESYNIIDLTSYIDPTKFNNIFAETAIDAQNFRIQIRVNMKMTHKMSARIMPNL